MLFRKLRIEVSYWLNHITSVFRSYRRITESYKKNIFQNTNQQRDFKKRIDVQKMPYAMDRRAIHNHNPSLKSQAKKTTTTHHRTTTKACQKHRQEIWSSQTQATNPTPSGTEQSCRGNLCKCYAFHYRVFSLTRLKNILQIYKCRVCSATSEVMCFKPKANKQGNHETVTAARDEQHEDTTNKARRNKAKKKKPKTAGLILPAPKKTPTPTVVHQQLSMAKLSNMLQRPTSQASKLNQFLKWFPRWTTPHSHSECDSTRTTPSPKCQLWSKLQIIFNYIHQQKHVAFHLAISPPHPSLTNPRVFRLHSAERKY